MSGTRRSTEQAAEAAHYQLPRPAGTVWLGLRLSSLLLLATALACAIVLVLAGAPAPVAVGLLLLAAVVTLVPVADRPALHWIGPATRHHLRRRHLTWSAPDADAAGRLRRAPLPPECGRLQVTELHTPDRSQAPAVALLLHNARRHSSRGHSSPGPRPRDASLPQYSQDLGTVSALPRGARTVVLEVGASGGFGLLDPFSQDTTLAGWGGALDALAADSRVLRVQWLTHTRLVAPSRPSLADADDLTRSLTRDLTGDYDDLVAAVTAQAWTHTHLLSVTLRPDVRGDARLDVLGLIEQIRDVTALLLTADVLARPLDLAELGSVLRLLTEPDYALDLREMSLRAQEASQDSSLDGGQASRPDQWGVRCNRADWTAVRTGDAWHRSYAIANWPSLPLPADWLTGLLGSTPPDGTSRTLSVHARPIAPVHAARQARAAAAKVQLDAADRSRFGLSGTPGSATPLDDQRATDAAALETELAAGYRMLHTRAVITVSATSQVRLQQAASTLRATAATHRLDLRPLHGQHQHGLVATLPLTVVPGTRP